MHRKSDERYYLFCSLAPGCVRLSIETAAILDFVEQQAIRFFARQTERGQNPHVTWSHAADAPVKTKHLHSS